MKFELTLAEATDKSLSESLGISKERMEALAAESKIIFLRKQKEGEPKLTMSGKLAEITGLCETLEEVVWAAFTFGLNVGANKANTTKIINVGSAEELKKILNPEKGGE